METCRTCARCDFEDETKWFDLFHSTRCQREIEEIRVEFNNWQLHISPHDGLPQKICSDCYSKFCNVYTFRLECQAAQVKLNNIFDKIETQSMDDDMADNLEGLGTQLLQMQAENSGEQQAKNNEINCQTDDSDAELLHILDSAGNYQAQDSTALEVEVPERHATTAVVQNAGTNVAYSEVSVAAVAAKDVVNADADIDTSAAATTSTTAVKVTLNTYTAMGKCLPDAEAHDRHELPNHVASKSAEGAGELLEQQQEAQPTQLQVDDLIEEDLTEEVVDDEHLDEQHEDTSQQAYVGGGNVGNANDDDPETYSETFAPTDEEAAENNADDITNDCLVDVDADVDGDGDDDDDDTVVNGIVEDEHLLEDDVDNDADGAEFDADNNENDDDDDGEDDDDDGDGVLEAFEPVFTLPTNFYNLSNNNNNNNGLPSDTDIEMQSSASDATAAPAHALESNELDTTKISIAFECKYCYRTKDTQSEHFLSQQALLEHITVAHDSEYPFTCPQTGCSEGFRDAASRTVHIKSEHVAKHYVCDVCGKKYADRFNLRHHHEKFHSDTDFECTNCGKRFYSRKSLNYHMKWHNPDLLLQCSQCDRLFINQRHLKCHEETHNGVRNCECCTFCGKTFIHLKTLRCHLYRQHGGEKPYKCAICTEAFASYLEKRMHMLENHLENLTTIERTECMLCRQHFNDEHELSEHIRSEHIERPKSATLIIANNKRVVRNKRQKRYSGIFQCEICAQRFNMKSALERHAAVHSTVGRPHKCPVESCAKRFKRAQDMNWHMKTHSNEKPNVCDVCGKGFALKYVLNQHKRSHEVLEKNFKCVTCGRAYLFEKSLRVHERVHTGKTYYKCDLCGENFVTHMKFKSHMMKMHDPRTTNLKDYHLDELAMP